MIKTIKKYNWILHLESKYPLLYKEEEIYKFVEEHLKIEQTERKEKIISNIINHKII